MGQASELQEIRKENGQRSDGRSGTESRAFLLCAWAWVLAFAAVLYAWACAAALRPAGIADVLDCLTPASLPWMLFAAAGLECAAAWVLSMVRKTPVLPLTNRHPVWSALCVCTLATVMVEIGVFQADHGLVSPDARSVSTAEDQDAWSAVRFTALDFPEALGGGRGFFSIVGMHPQDGESDAGEPEAGEADTEETGMGGIRYDDNLAVVEFPDFHSRLGSVYVDPMFLPGEDGTLSGTDLMILVFTESGTRYTFYSTLTEDPASHFVPIHLAEDAAAVSVCFVGKGVMFLETALNRAIPLAPHGLRMLLLTLALFLLYLLRRWAVAGERGTAIGTDGTVTDRPVADGAVMDGIVVDGTVADGAVTDGTVADGVQEQTKRLLPSGFTPHALEQGLARLMPVLLVLWVLLPLLAMAGMPLAAQFRLGGSDDGEVSAHIFYIWLFRGLGFVTLSAVTLRILCRPWPALRDAVCKRRWLIPPLFLLLWACVSTRLSENPAGQFWGSPYRADGLISGFFYVAVLICAVSCADADRDRLLPRLFDRDRLLLRLFAAVTAACTLLMLGQAAEIPQITAVYGSGLDAVFGQFNHLGYLLCMGLLCLAGLTLYETGRGWKTLWAALFALETYCLLLNDTFGCYLAVLAALPAAYLLFFRSGRRFRPELLAPAVLFLALSALNLAGALPMPETAHNALGDNFSTLAGDIHSAVTTPETSGDAGTGRLGLWKEAVRITGQRPLFGYGPEGLTTGYQNRVGNDRPHNEYIQYAVFLGIPALLAYLAMLLMLFRRQWGRIPRLPATALTAAGIVTAYLVSATFGNTMFYTSPYLWLMLGLASRGSEEP